MQKTLNVEELQISRQEKNLTQQWNMRFGLRKTHKYNDTVQRFSGQKKKLGNNFHLFTKYLLGIYSTAIVSQEEDERIQVAVW